MGLQLSREIWTEWPEGVTDVQMLMGAEVMHTSQSQIPNSPGE